MHKVDPLFPLTKTWQVEIGHKKSLWLRFGRLNTWVSVHASKALGLVPLFDDLESTGWRRRRDCWLHHWHFIDMSVAPFESFDALIITSCPKESSCAIQKWCFSWRCRKVASRLYHWLLVAFLIYGIVKLAIELSICSGEDQAVKLVVAVLTNLWSCCLMQRVFVEAFCGRSSNVSGSCKIGLLARLCKEWTQMDVWWTNQTACIENLRRGRFNTIKQLHKIVQNHFVCWQISDWLCAVNPVWRTRLALHTGRPWQWICYCWLAQWWSCAAGVASWITRLLGCSQLSRKSGWIDS